MKPFKINDNKLQSGFSVPDGYFEVFAKKIQLPSASKSDEIITLQHKTKYNWYAAAAIIVLCLSLPLANHFSQNRAIEDQAIEDYLSAQSSITQQHLVELLNPEDIKALEEDLMPDDAVIEEALLNNPDLQEYIIN